MVKWGEMKKAKLTMITGLTFPETKVRNDEGPYPEEIKEIFRPFHGSQSFFLVFCSDFPVLQNTTITLNLIK